MENFTLQKDKTGLLVIDVQEKLFSKIDRPVEVMESMQKVIRGFQVFDLPIVVSEQYPQGLGSTIAALKGLFPSNKEYHSKTTFSCCGDASLRKYLDETLIKNWILIGIEAHVCVLQTAKDLMRMGCQVTVLNDAISSRSIFDFSTAIAEMRDIGVRISCVETVLFELCHDANSPEFKQISQLIKESCGSSCSLS